VIGFAGVLLDVVVFYIGFFFLYWGVWNYLFGSPVPGLFFGILMIVSGAALVGLGVLGALRLYSFLSSPSFRNHDP